MFSFIQKRNRLNQSSREQVASSGKNIVTVAVESQPSTQIFENFGICGNCEVVTREGLLPLKNIWLSDALVTRSHGFVHPVCMMMNSNDAKTKEGPRAGAILSGSLGNNLPQGDIAIGVNSTLISYQRTGAAPRPKPVANGPSSREEMNILIDCPVEELCVPVFETRVEILMHGIYVLCPSMIDVSLSAATQGTAA
ncbi:MAG: hypothetical protein ABJR46_01695 [Tateyamaria sp.]|uniref:hypothetical protein n=1 Tax=Tateyamaria sp. TaxID=1929288 RepID=UPI0032A01271